MSFIDGLRYRVRAWLRRDAFERDLEDELAFHVELDSMHREHVGAVPADARGSARRRLGNLAHIKEESRRMTGRDRIESLFKDVRWALRSAVRDPLVSACIIVTLALGIGVNAAVFGIAQRLVFKGPEHVTDPGALVRVLSTKRMAGDALTGPYWPYPEYPILRDAAHSLESIAVYGWGILTSGRGQGAQKFRTHYVGKAYFTTLGVIPLAGRYFTNSESDPTVRPRVAILEEHVWRRMHPGEPFALGRLLELNGINYEIIGLMPGGFTGPDLGALEAWLPIGIAGEVSNSTLANNWGYNQLQIFARLKPGVTLAQATADVAAAHRACGSGASRILREATLDVAPLAYTSPGIEPTRTRLAKWLAALAAIVLLMSCANVVSLLLARALRRRAEIGVRLALGAGRARLIRLFLIESLLLSVIGAASALIVAALVGSAMRALLFSTVAWTGPVVDGRTLVALLMIALVVAAIAGLVPAMRASSFDVSGALKVGSRATRRTTRLRATLTIVQTATSVVLLAAAGLFLRSAWKASSLDLGFDPGRVLVVDAQWAGAVPFSGPSAEEDYHRRTAFFENALASVRALPAVEHASLAVGLPFIAMYGGNIGIPGRGALPEPEGVTSLEMSAVGPAYFETIGTKVLRGRAFVASDDAAGEPVLIVGELVARIYWPGADPLGACVSMRTAMGEVPCARIVGIAEDVYRDRLRGALPAMHYYVPIAQARARGQTELIVRTRKPAVVAARITQMLYAMDPELASVDARTIQERVLERETHTWRAGAQVLGITGLLALLVAAAGIFSVMSYSVAQRTHEIGVRIALGAQPRDVFVLVTRQGAGMAAVGVAVGLAVAVAAAPFIAPHLFELPARDPLVLGGVAALLLLVAFAASLVPASRANRVNPVEALASQ